MIKNWEGLSQKLLDDVKLNFHIIKCHGNRKISIVENLLRILQTSRYTVCSYKGFFTCL